MKVRVRNASSERYQDIGWTEDWRGTGMWVPVTNRRNALLLLPGKSGASAVNHLAIQVVVVV